MSASANQCLRILAKGGLAVRCEEGYAVYREQDARRRVVGILSRDLFASLVEDQLVELRGDRFIWTAGRCPQIAETPRPNVTTDAPKSTKPRRLLQKALALAPDEDEQLRLVRAARRFIADLTAARAGPVVTMNWELIPRGKGGNRSSTAPGQRPDAVRAQRTLDRLRAELDSDVVDILIALLCDSASQRFLASNYGFSPRTLPRRIYGYLMRLADAYDQSVPVHS